ncbi:MAG: GAF domain-containing SpoIIE family protein phosphatase [Verrucomicrobiota bacterium]
MIWILIFILLLLCGWLWRRWYLSDVREMELRDRFKTLQNEKKVVFDFLHNLGDALTDGMDLDYMLETVLNGAEKVTEARGGIVYLLNPKTKKLVVEVVHGIFPPPFQIDDATADKIMTHWDYLETFLKNESIPIDSTNLIAQVCRDKRYLWIPDATHDNRFPKFKDDSMRMKTLVAVPLSYQNEPIGVIALANRIDNTPFRETDLEMLKSLGEQASFAIHSMKTYRQLIDRRKLDDDLQLASEIQKILLPDQSPKINGFDVVARNYPAQQLSGDYFDFIQIDSQHYGVAIADVSGKGVPASIIMAMCRSILRSKAIGNPSPAEVLKAVNRQISPDIRKDMFITMIYLVINTETHEVKIARAGHELPLLLEKAQGELTAIQSSGLALGIDDGEIFDEVIEEKKLKLEVGDTLLLYTDGVTEALDDKGQEFDRENLISSLKNGSSLLAFDLLDNIVERVRRHIGSQNQLDDITLAIIRRT